MALAYREAEKRVGETGTLKYLKAYRAVYAEQHLGERGVDVYLAEIDRQIREWEQGKKPPAIEFDVPMMGRINEPTLIQKIRNWFI